MTYGIVEHPLDLDLLYSPPVVVVPFVAVDLAAIVLAGGVR